MMETRTITLRSSNPETLYLAIVEYDDDGVCFMRCSCDAGIMKTFCKHLRTFFECDESLLANQDEAETFRELSSLVLRSMPGSRYSQMLAAIKIIEGEEKLLKKQKAELKIQFTHDLYGPSL